MSVLLRVTQWALARGLSVADVVEWWNERAAIREYDGGYSLELAEQVAFETDVLSRFAPDELPPW